MELAHESEQQPTPVEATPPAEAAPAPPTQTRVRTGTLPPVRVIVVAAAMGCLLLVTVGAIAALDNAYKRIAVLEDRASAFEALEMRTERERQIRSWIITQNPKALLADFNEFAEVLLEQAAEHQLDYRVVMAVIQKESRWEPDAVGRDGEIGLMQVRPTTAARVAEKLGIEFVPPKRNGRGAYADLGSLRDPGMNVRLGMAYLRDQIEEFGLQPEALQAYNRGPGRARLTWLWDSYAADVARNFGALVLWEGFPATLTREESSGQ